MLRPEVGGRVSQVLFKDGQKVKKGQILVQFDDQLPAAQVAQSKAELSIAQAQPQAQPRTCCAKLHQQTFFG